MNLLMKENDKSRYILLKAKELFFKYGLKSVTVDDICKSAGISKKTIYEYFPNKSALVYAVFEAYINDQQDKMMQLKQKEGGNSIDIMIEVYELNHDVVQEFNPNVIFDLQRFYPEAYNLFEDHKKSFIFKKVIQNIKCGQQEGLYRKDLNPEIIANLYVARIDLLMQEDIFPPKEFPFTLLMRELFMYHLRGIASLEGIAYLNQQQKKHPKLSL